MPEAILAIFLPVLILVVIFTFVISLKLIRGFSERGANRQQVHQLSQSLQEIQKEVSEIKSQLADIIITLHDRV